MGRALRRRWNCRCGGAIAVFFRGDVLTRLLEDTKYIGTSAGNVGMSFICPMMLELFRRGVANAMSSTDARKT